MILVDYRGGSCELVDPLKKRGLPVEETTLPAGDIVFEGKGVKGASVMVGIEYKKLPDFISSVRSERLQDIQLTGMQDAGIENKWLFIEGELLYDEQGKLLKRCRNRRELKYLEGGMGVGELLKRLFVFHLCGGLTPWWTQNQKQTVTAIEMLYRTWTDVNLDEHTSHLGVYTPPTLVPISDFRAVVMQFPGIGQKTSLAVERYFDGCLLKAVNASAQTWARIETTDSKGKTRKLGMSTAERIVSFVREPHASD